MALFVFKHWFSSRHWSKFEKCPGGMSPSVGTAWQCVQEAWRLPGASAVVVFEFPDVLQNEKLKKVLKFYPHKHTHGATWIYVLRWLEWLHGTSTLKKCRWLGSTALLESVACWEILEEVVCIKIGAVLECCFYCEERRKERKGDDGELDSFVCYFHNPRCLWTGTQASSMRFRQSLTRAI